MSPNKETQNIVKKFINIFILKNKSILFMSIFIAASERCSENARNAQGGRNTASAHHHLHQQAPVCQNIGP